MIDADFLDDQELSCLFLFNQVGFAKGSFSEKFLFLVDLILSFKHSYFHFNI